MIDLGSKFSIGARLDRKLGGSIGEYIASRLGRLLGVLVRLFLPVLGGPVIIADSWKVVSEQAV